MHYIARITGYYLKVSLFLSFQRKKSLFIHKVFSFQQAVFHSVC